VIVISWRFGEYCGQRGAATERLHIVPNWGNEGEQAVDNVKAERFRASLGLCQDTFLCVYGGNINAASGIETVIHSFAYLRELGKLSLLIAGEGSQLSICRDLAKKDDSQRILFHSPWPRVETFTVLSAADVLILPTRGNQSLVSVPSKLIAYLLSARPIIALAHADSDLAELISKSGCGWVVEPDQPERLSGMIKEIMNMEPAERRHHGQMGRDFALKNMTRTNNLPRVINIIEKAAQA
jgi:glycosyltransferase involved in cell wall biosynthesis